MRKQTRSPDTVFAPDPAEVATAARLLRAAAECETMEASDRELDHVLSRAARSMELTEATFAAVQTLRDLGTIDRAEAAWLFDELFDRQLERYEKSDPALRLAEAKAAFHRARGEEMFAEMILMRPEEHDELCAEGGLMLIEGKAINASPVLGAPDPRNVALIAERILAYASLETWTEMIRQWSMIGDTSPTEDTASAVAAVQGLRSVGAVSEAEAAFLLDRFLYVTFLTACEADRECQRLYRSMESIERAHGVGVERPFTPGEEPFEWKLLDAQLDRRANRLAALWLRRYGEHRLANLILERPEEYERLVDEGMSWGRDRR